MCELPVVGSASAAELPDPEESPGVSSLVFLNMAWLRDWLSRKPSLS